MDQGAPQTSANDYCVNQGLFQRELLPHEGPDMSAKGQPVQDDPRAGRGPADPDSRSPPTAGKGWKSPLRCLQPGRTSAELRQDGSPDAAEKSRLILLKDLRSKSPQGRGIRSDPFSSRPSLHSALLNLDERLPVTALMK